MQAGGVANNSQGGCRACQRHAYSKGTLGSPVSPCSSQFFTDNCWQGELVNALSQSLLAVSQVQLQLPPCHEICHDIFLAGWTRKATNEGA